MQSTCKFRRVYARNNHSPISTPIGMAIHSGPSDTDHRPGRRASHIVSVTIKAAGVSDIPNTLPCQQDGG